MNITIHTVHKSYPGGVTALAGVSAGLEPGVTGLVGPNGAGKSTLINLIVGLILPGRGELRVDGRPLEQQRGHLYRNLGYLPQSFQPYPALSVVEFLDYMAILKGLNAPRLRRERVADVLHSLNLEAYARRRTAALSGGTRQRLGIAQALLNRPQLLVLDEPTAGLDPEERQRFHSLLAGLACDRTVLIASHILNDLAATCSHLLVLEQGRLLWDGTPEGLRQRARGRVWEVSLPAADFERCRPAWQVVNARVEGAQVVARVLAGEAGPACTANPAARLAVTRPVEPALEEAYLAARMEM